MIYIATDIKAVEQIGTTSVSTPLIVNRVVSCPMYFFNWGMTDILVPEVQHNDSIFIHIAEWLPQ